ncbi:MAG: tRNA 4-thiouridine(8) synthase ThiI [Deltaproteobacteria bacterium]|nr:tRNA 4-thiouridine(8) synthase ThiI [Deltaproteobacteria bacterium]
MISHAVLLRYHEIALKGGNRHWFENQLIHNTQKTIQKICKSNTILSITKQRGRILIHTEQNFEHALVYVFGLSSFSPVLVLPTQLEEIKKITIQELTSIMSDPVPPKTFRITTRRSDKTLVKSSVELDALLGAEVLKHFPQLKVNLKKPDLNLGVEIRNQNTFLWTRKHKCLGGIPVGISGHFLCLLSGGIDSPVAAIQMSKRGAKISLIHFHGAPFIGNEILEKIEALAKIISLYQPESVSLYIVPFGKLQEQIALNTSVKVRTILYRRMMIRISSELAKKIKAQALITGESLGQVASQTIENLVNIEAVSLFPLLRPLISFDKDEIIELSKKWGTYETSIQPTLDCCTLFADKHPETKSKIELLEREESKLDLNKLKDVALAETTEIPL